MREPDTEEDARKMMKKKQMKWQDVKRMPSESRTRKEMMGVWKKMPLESKTMKNMRAWKKRMIIYTVQIAAEGRSLDLLADPVLYFIVFGRPLSKRIARQPRSWGRELQHLVINNETHGCYQGETMQKLTAESVICSATPGVILPRVKFGSLGDAEEAYNINYFDDDVFPSQQDVISSTPQHNDPGASRQAESP
ncbi:hypothetical protein OS493_031418 [Desmophyllum pertusum]|uniref:Uncharacterized protein n=1 Tax=Desmophyllum pertusum TaxID=174260 RepID=A0A9W9ZYD2_9CNID|nr:hypothetical protein OS493_031418 [Desmophyllum pertusum]